MFHPRGSLFHFRFLPSQQEIKLHPYGMARISAALWKKERHFEALGIALRFSPIPIMSPSPTSEDQDLLFASFFAVWQTPLALFITNGESYFTNEYSTIAPIEMNQKLYEFRLFPEDRHRSRHSRETELAIRVLHHRARFLLKRRIWKKGKWEEIGFIELTESARLDQEALRFHPFLNGLGLKPRGFIHHLRKGAYDCSQWARPRRSHPVTLPPAEENALPSSPPSHSPSAWT